MRADGAIRGACPNAAFAIVLRHWEIAQDGAAGAGRPGQFQPRSANRLRHVRGHVQNLSQPGTGRDTTGAGLGRLRYYPATQFGMNRAFGGQNIGGAEGFIHRSLASGDGLNNCPAGCEPAVDGGHRGDRGNGARPGVDRERVAIKVSDGDRSGKRSYELLSLLLDLCRDGVVWQGGAVDGPANLDYAHGKRRPVCPSPKSIWLPWF